ncbi:uncharacterized protein LOC124201668 [Daphnia pulex]|uniref:uncharacterized protein LOC124201668 n=1 Tax=Daphnia pulex TaxID=6669 RepID=UPI001EDF433F|nr:uncharacterized protein LOC124201668 [Daphnia pulex]
MSDAELHLNVKRNISGHITKIDGVAFRILVAFANRYNFTYSILQVNDTRLEKQSEALPGLAYYLQTGKCDLIIGALVMTPARYALMDFAEGYDYSSVVVLIPMPESSNNGAAIFLPFQLYVWIGLLIIIPLTAVAICFSIEPVNRMTQTDENVTIDQPVVSNKIGRFLLTTRIVFIQMMRILLNQGAYFPRMRTAAYFVVGSWCLGALILGCAYNSLLVSYILGLSNAEPLVDYIFDLARNSNVQLVVDKGRGTELFLLTAKIGLYKQLGDKLRSQSKSNCATRQECIDLVKSGSYAYLNVILLGMSDNKEMI